MNMMLYIRYIINFYRVRQDNSATKLGFFKFIHEEKNLFFKFNLCHLSITLIGHHIKISIFKFVIW